MVVYIVKPGVSWEAHLSGAIIGFVLSIFFLKKGPQKEKYEWEDEDNEDNEDNENNEDNNN